MTLEEAKEEYERLTKEMQRLNAEQVRVQHEIKKLKKDFSPVRVGDLVSVKPGWRSKNKEDRIARVAEIECGYIAVGARPYIKVNFKKQNGSWSKVAQHPGGEWEVIEKANPSHGEVVQLPGKEV